MQNFDYCQQKIIQIVIKAGEIIRHLKGLPEERNITVLYEETAPLFGIPIIQQSSQDIDHLPHPGEMKNEKGGFIIPRRNCPSCGEKETMLLGPLCQSCQDAEGGKYKAMWKCERCGYKDKSEKHFMLLMSELGVEVPTGSKRELGIRTYTDDGLK